MSYKDFYDLGQVDANLVVSPALLAIRNAVDSAVTGVSTVAQVAATYAKQYSVVEKQEVDSSGHVTDVTSTPRNHVALYEVQDAKRRILQVQANIDQYLLNVSDTAEVGITSPNIVSVTKKTAGSNLRVFGPSGGSDPIFDYKFTLHASVSAYQSAGITHVKVSLTKDTVLSSQLTSIGVGGMPWRDYYFINASNKGICDLHSLSVAIITTNNSPAHNSYTVYLETAMNDLGQWYYRICVGESGGYGSYVSGWIAGPSSNGDVGEYEICQFAETGTLQWGSQFHYATENACHPSRLVDEWLLPSAMHPELATTSTDTFYVDTDAMHATPLDPDATTSFATRDSSSLRSLVKEALPPFAQVVTQLDALIMP